jgi:molecular chaperone DnaK (HSP70)
MWYLIVIPPGRTTNEEVERMIRDADSKKTEDEAECTRMQARNSLESYVRWVMLIMKECSITELHLSQTRKVQTKQLCDEITAWLNTGQVAHIIHISS